MTLPRPRANNEHQRFRPTGTRRKIRCRAPPIIRAQRNGPKIVGRESCGRGDASLFPRIGLNHHRSIRQLEPNAPAPACVASRQRLAVDLVNLSAASPKAAQGGLYPLDEINVTRDRLSISGFRE
jgi:hypothetical protein